MRTMLVGLFVALCATTAHAQTIFTMNDSGTPSAGWPGGAVPTSATHERVHLPASGPQGGPAWEFRQRYAPAEPGYGGEFYWGWNGTIESDPPQGARRFYRWRMRFDPANNWRGTFWQDGSPINITNKILMVGDGCGRNNCRVIVSYRGVPDGSGAEVRIAIDGGVTPTPDVFLPKGQWLDIQLEADSSTTTSSGDGAFKLWVNNNDYTRPTSQITGIQLNPVRWGYVFLGAYNNNGLASGGVQNFRVAGFQAATTFDASWTGGVSPPPPPDPVDCEVSAFALSAFDDWSACSAGTQTRMETWTRTVTQQPANGGAACPALSETRTGSQSCTPPPPPPPLTPTIRMDCTRIVSITRNADYANGDQRWTVRGQCVETSAGVVTGPPPQ